MINKTKTRSSGWSNSVLPRPVDAVKKHSKGIKESEIQRGVVKYCRERGIRVMASASGIACNSAGIVNNLRSLGIIQDKGYPDLFIPHVKRNRYGYIESCGLFIELKAEKGVIRSEQQEMLEALRYEGYDAVVCRSVDNAINIINSYFDYDVRELKVEPVEGL